MSCIHHLNPQGDGQLALARSQSFSKIFQNFTGLQNLVQVAPDVERRKYELYTPLELTGNRAARTGTIPEF